MKISKEGPPGRFQYDWDEIVAMGKAHPGEWIKPEREYPHSLYSALRNGKNSRLPPSEWDFRTSSTNYDIEGKRWCHIHFKYTPTEESKA